MCCARAHASWLLIALAACAVAAVPLTPQLGGAEPDPTDESAVGARALLSVIPQHSVHSLRAHLLKHLEDPASDIAAREAGEHLFAQDRRMMPQGGLMTNGIARSEAGAAAPSPLHDGTGVALVMFKADSNVLRTMMGYLAVIAENSHASQAGAA